MKMKSSQDIDFSDKMQEDGKIGKTSSSSHPVSASPSSSWLRLKNPRIVRVSRAFGGKDRHSKVCTVRGLRDRRVRLSVPTAIQLYDLQDRLGLNQPSKVVDWLLNVAKDDIDELPPLQMPPLSFLRNHVPHEFKIGEDVNDWEARASFWSQESVKGKSKQVVLESEKEGFNLPHHHMPYWEPSNNFPLPNLGMSMTRFEEVHHHNLSLPGQILVCPPGPATQPYFPAVANPSNPAVEVDPRQFSQFQMLMMSSSGGSSQNLLPSSHLYSIGQPARPFQFEFGVGGSQHSQNKNQQEQFQESVLTVERLRKREQVLVSETEMDEPNKPVLHKIQ